MANFQTNSERWMPNFDQIYLHQISPELPPFRHPVLDAVPKSRQNSTSETKNISPGSLVTKTISDASLVTNTNSLSDDEDVKVIYDKRVDGPQKHEKTRTLSEIVEAISKALITSNSILRQDSGRREMAVELINLIDSITKQRRSPNDPIPNERYWRSIADAYCRYVLNE